MIKPIMKDVLFLKRKSEPATKEDMQVARDLIDTLIAHKDECVGMAANMIGVLKNIIVIDTGLMPMIMFNPVIKSKSGAFETTEGCLSLVGERPVARYEKIEVEFEDMNFVKKIQVFEGWIAEIIQHEIDHLSGIII